MTLEKRIEEIIKMIGNIANRPDITAVQKEQVRLLLELFKENVDDRYS